MNLNQRIEEIRGDGIPGYNAKINQMIRFLNWLMGVRVVNGRPVFESDSGPVFDLSPAMAQGGNQLWMTDPDGNAAGWVLMTMINTQTLQYYDSWVWAGPSKNLRDVPWLKDPDNKLAHWVACAQNTFWGTGVCPTTSGNFQVANISGPSVYNTNPYIWTCVAPVPPIVLSPSGSPFFLETYNSPSGPNQPCIFLVGGLAQYPLIGTPWSFTITYDGTQVLSYNGTIAQDVSNGAYVPLDPTGWVYDPSGLPGYSKGSNKWVWQYSGASSGNTNPTILQTLSWGTTPSGTFLHAVNMGVVFMTG